MDMCTQKLLYTLAITETVDRIIRHSRHSKERQFLLDRKSISLLPLSLPPPLPPSLLSFFLSLSLSLTFFIYLTLSLSYPIVNQPLLHFLAWLLLWQRCPRTTAFSWLPEACRLSGWTTSSQEWCDVHVIGCIFTSNPEKTLRFDLNWPTVRREARINIVHARLQMAVKSS